MIDLCLHHNSSGNGIMLANVHIFYCRLHLVKYIVFRKKKEFFFIFVITLSNVIQFCQ